MKAVLKLGGSLITDKKLPYTPRRKVIERLAKEVSKALEKGVRIAIVHGGGSYGHYEASSSIAQHGRLMDEDIPRISHSMLLLNSIVEEAFVSRGVPALSFPPHALCLAGWSGGFKCDFSRLMDAFVRGLVPLTYGDIVMGEKRYPPQIISGDDLSLQLSSILQADRLVFAMDVPGVLEKIGEPETLIREIDAASLDEILERVGGSGGKDVTGGLRAKLEKIRRGITSNTLRKTEIILLSGLIEGNTYEALIGGTYKGTLIHIE